LEENLPIRGDRNHVGVGMVAMRTKACDECS
jgi:hypothetical protein